MLLIRRFPAGPHIVTFCTAPMLSRLGRVHRGWKDLGSGPESRTPKCWLMRPACIRCCPRQNLEPRLVPPPKLPFAVSDELPEAFLRREHALQLSKISRGNMRPKSRAEAHSCSRRSISGLSPPYFLISVHLANDICKHGKRSNYQHHASNKKYYHFFKSPGPPLGFGRGAVPTLCPVAGLVILPVATLRAR